MGPEDVLGEVVVYLTQHRRDEIEWRRNLMAAIDDLTAAVTVLQTEQAAVSTAVEDLVAEVAALNTEIAALQAAGADTTAIEAQVAKINTITAALTSAAASDPGAQPTGGTTPPPPPATVFDPADDLPLYEYSGTDPVQSPPWTNVADVTGPEGLPLYTFAGDTAGQAPTGTATDWTPYTGTLVTVPPTS